MKQLPAIEAAYTLLASVLDERLEDARLLGDQAAIASVLEKQKIHDAAYFVLVWGQFEAEVNSACVRAITRRKQDADWEKRRAWDAYPEQENDLRIRFEDRLALLVDRKNTTSSGYRDAIKYYNQRNMIAHGKSLATGIDVPAVINDLHQIRSMFAK